MRKTFLCLAACALLTQTAYAGFSVGMTGSVIKRVQKLDDRVKQKNQELPPVAPPPASPGTGWVLVPGNSSLGTSDFYVMAYEAKNVGGVATSQADLTPWGNITHPSAVAACAALGGGAHLVTIAEAQTININIAAQSTNWANGVIGSLVSAGGGLKRGNNMANDSATYDHGDFDYGAIPSAERILKAKLVLSTGGELWDWAGNVWELLYGAGANGAMGIPGGVAFDGSGYGQQWSSVALNEERPVIGPSDSSWTTDNGVGYYYGGTTITGGMLRGGGRFDGANSGVFAYSPGNELSFVTVEFGFRCAR